jgi:hypothetical protein
MRRQNPYRQGHRASADIHSAHDAESFPRYLSAEERHSNEQQDFAAIQDFYLLRCGLNLAIASNERAEFQSLLSTFDRLKRTLTFAGQEKTTLMQKFAAGLRGKCGGCARTYSTSRRSLPTQFSGTSSPGSRTQRPALRRSDRSSQIFTAPRGLPSHAPRGRRGAVQGDYT